MAPGTASAETHSFQAEIKQLLDLVINSLYTHREIFVRELISNAADALERIRHEQLVNKDLGGDHVPLEIQIELDKDGRTFRISDSGDGMTRDQLAENLGTIAHSGTRSYLSKLAASAQQDVNLIGQFGVGFYSAFMVAKKVTVETKSYHPDSPGWRWESDGSGEYTISPAEGLTRGTRITIELKDDASEYAEDVRIKQIIRQFSNFVSFPILVNSEKVNTIQAIWLRNKSEVTEEEYNEFFKFISNSGADPAYRMHFSADAPLAINALLFVPKENFESFGFGRLKPGVDLHCRRVLIMKQPEELLPEWMRFVKGVVDSEDLPLNISRETLQDSSLVRKLSRVIVGRFIKHLTEQAKADEETYNEFFRAFGGFLKEGAAQDFAHREELSTLLRFESSMTEKGKLTSLGDYVSRMGEEQKQIYFINGPSREAIEAGPYVEAFRARGLEVLYLYEPIDDFVMSNLGQFQEKELVSADRGDLELAGEAAMEGEELPSDAAGELCGWLKRVLGEERVHEVKASKRLVGSPAAATTQGPMSSAMQRMMMSIQGEEQLNARFLTLEVNPRHALVHRLNALRAENEEFARDLAEQLYDNALLAAGLLTDPRRMVERLNKLLAKAAGA